MVALYQALCTIVQLQSVRNSVAIWMLRLEQDICGVGHMCRQPLGACIAAPQLLYSCPVAACSPISLVLLLRQPSKGWDY